MRHVTFYHGESGVLNGVSLLVSDDTAVELNEKLYPGHKAIDHPPDGLFDHRTQRVDVTSGEVLPWDGFKSTPSAVAAPTACQCPKHGA